MGRKQRTSRVVSPPHPPAEPEELDLEAFSRSLHPSGLCIRDVSNDGNCFFRAVSDQLYGTEEYHMKLRERACDYLQAHKSHYRHFVDDEQSFDDYVADMRNDGVWADNLELQAISMAYNVNIRIHQSGKPSYDIYNHVAKNARAIHLSYHFGEHYASVRPLHSADLTLPAQHEPLPLPRPAVPTATSREQQSSQERASRRPRQRKSVERKSVERKPVDAVEDDIKAVWKRADRGYCDLCDLVDRTRRAARAIHKSESFSDGTDEKRDAAKRIEREMKDARTKLTDVEKAINDGQNAQQFRSKKITHVRRNQFQHDASDSDGLSSYSEDDGEDEEQYKKAVRRETDQIFERLNEIENAVRLATEKVTALSIDKSAEPRSSRPGRTSKRKEQEAKKRERKERRRREQEKAARGEDVIRTPRFSRTHRFDIAI